MLYEMNHLHLQIAEILKPLRLENESYIELMKRMNDDMVNGLSVDNNMAADLKMYITYVRSVPDGTGKKPGDRFNLAFCQL